MIVERIHINLIRLPFRVAYGHKQKTHNDVFAVICQIEDSEGHSGLGEAIPRAYVTGETAQSVFENAQTLGKQLLGKKFFSYDEVQKIVVNLSKEWSTPFPSCAFCCVDMALHDCLARYLDQDMCSYLGTTTKPLAYTGSIGLGNKVKLLALLSAYRLSGIRSFKLKVGDEHDSERLRTIKNFMGQNTPVFADANGAWSTDDAPAKIDSLAKHGVWAIEEPLHIPMPLAETHESSQINRDETMQEAHFQQYAQLRKKITVPVILDESLISSYSFKNIINHNSADILNIRLSKLGGFSLTSKMLAEKPDAMNFSLGAMVGESPILAAAGYFFGCSNPNHLYIQGYSHRILHGAKFVSGGPVMKHGKVSGMAKHAGLDLTLKPDILEALTQKKVTLAYEKA